MRGEQGYRSGLGQNESDRDKRLWLWGIAAIWLLACAWLLYSRWTAIQWFALGDTDDNLRIAQVRAWLGGQGWFDLRQYRLDPPTGANIHWSRLVDIPIAGIILLVKPLFGGVIAEKTAVAVAPMLPLALALVSMGLTARRLIDPRASAIAALLLLFSAGNALAMFSPLRIDHHGWQLAFVALAVAGWADPQPRRGGLTVGAATALSLVVGLEMLPLLGLCGAFIVLRWVLDFEQAARARAYGLSLALGSGVGFLLFASYANRGPVCDALSPVWLSVTIGGGGLVFALSFLPNAMPVRLAAALAVALLVGGSFAWAFPDCLSRPEGVSPELQRLWLDKVREARPVYLHEFRTMVTMVAPLLVGLAGYAVVLWRERRSPCFALWLGLATLSLVSASLLLWQTRAAPSAQLLSVPGAAALVWMVIRWGWAAKNRLVRIVVPIIALFLASGLVVSTAFKLMPKPQQTAHRKAVSLANRRCPTLPALRPIASLPPATIMSFVDFGPRLISVTHHKAIAGPYHRNQTAILDIHHAFRGTALTAHEVMRRHGATLLLICPGMSESTIYRAETPNGFYSQLMSGRVPHWLQRMPLPKNSPFMLWRRVE